MTQTNLTLARSFKIELVNAQRVERLRLCTDSVIDYRSIICTEKYERTFDHSVLNI